MIGTSMARRGSRSRRGSAVTGVMAVLAIVAILVLSGVVWRQQIVVSDLRAALTEARREADTLGEHAELLSVENGDLARHLEQALSLSETIQARADAMEIALEQARAEAESARQTRLQVREVRGTADFPIERAMAKAGDTVIGFAAREGTTEDVLRALNPWLDGAGTLSAWQTLWVPKTDR